MENIMSSKLFTTRQGTIVLGVVAAVLAAIALLVYLNQYRNSVTRGQVFQVLVAKSLIPANTSGNIVASTGLYKLENFAKNQVKAGALDPATLNGTVALQDINPGQQLTAADFGTCERTGPPAHPRPARGRHPARLAVRGRRTDQPGDHVDVWVLATKGATPVAHELLQNMTC